jgi:hypothetical protein
VVVVKSCYRDWQKRRDIIGQIFTEDFVVLFVCHLESFVVSFLGKLGGSVVSNIWACLGDYRSEFSFVQAVRSFSFPSPAEEARVTGVYIIFMGGDVGRCQCYCLLQFSGVRGSRVGSGAFFAAFCFLGEGDSRFRRSCHILDKARSGGWCATRSDGSFCAEDSDFGRAVDSDFWWAGVNNFWCAKGSDLRRAKNSDFCSGGRG